LAGGLESRIAFGKSLTKIDALAERRGLAVKKPSFIIADVSHPALLLRAASFGECEPADLPQQLQEFRQLAFQPVARLLTPLRRKLAVRLVRAAAG
jgi:hypothetical protein